MPPIITWFALVGSTVIFGLICALQSASAQSFAPEKKTPHIQRVERLV